MLKLPPVLLALTIGIVAAKREAKITTAIAMSITVLPYIPIMLV
jgi:hypothetical protein